MALVHGFMHGYSTMIRWHMMSDAETTNYFLVLLWTLCQTSTHVFIWSQMQYKNNVSFINVRSTCTRCIIPQFQDLFLCIVAPYNLISMQLSSFIILTLYLFYPYPLPIPQLIHSCQLYTDSGGNVSISWLLSWPYNLRVSTVLNPKNYSFM